MYCTRHGPPFFFFFRKRIRRRGVRMDLIVRALRFSSERFSGAEVDKFCNDRVSLGGWGNTHTRKKPESSDGKLVNRFARTITRPFPCTSPTPSRRDRWRCRYCRWGSNTSVTYRPTAVAQQRQLQRLPRGGPVLDRVFCNDETDRDGRTAVSDGRGLFFWTTAVGRRRTRSRPR